MLDIHCHILTGVDDGPATAGEALEMARRYVADGITHLIATPHCNAAWPNYREDVLPRVQLLRRALQETGIPLTLLPGSEIQLTDTMAYRQLYEEGRYCHLNDDPGFSLLEFPWRAQHYPEGAVELVKWLRERGTQPIIPHPERQPFFRDDVPRLSALVEAGAWLQITVDSLTGCNGERVQESGIEFMNSFEDIVLASDAHGLHRCSGLAAGYDFVREMFGAAREEDVRARGWSIIS